jgi:RNA polymerase sigma factor (sigma-70 family)
MTSSPMARVVHHLRKAALVHDGAGMTDGQLLESYIAQRDEAAFEVLVRRHGPMVMGVTRRVTGNVHDAEDAFQATFLVLVRRAFSIVPREMVGNWLYGVAYRTALEAKVKTARRHAKMKQVTEMSQPAVQVEEVWRDLEPLIDQELSRLPDKYRLPLVLCQLEGRSRKEVAKQLKLPEGTLSSRLATARQLLAGRLTSRGVAIAAGPLALILTQQAASASVRAVLVNATIQSAALVAAGKTTAAISPKVAALTQGVLRTMFMTKLKVAGMYLMLAAGLIVLGSGALIDRTRADNQSDRPAVAPDQSRALVALRAQPAREQDRDAKTETVTGILKAVDAGKNSVTISIAVARDQPPAEKTFQLGNDCTVVQDGNKVKLADLRPGHSIALALAADKKDVVSINVSGPTVSGKLLAVDPAKNTITISFPMGRDGVAVEKTFALAERHRIVQDGKAAKLSDLKAGTSVTAAVSTDDKTVFAITVSGRTISAQFKSFDAAKNSITISLIKDRDGNTEEKTHLLAKGLTLNIGRKETSPAELKVGTPLRLTFAAADANTIVQIHVQPEPGKDR